MAKPSLMKTPKAPSARRDDSSEEEEEEDGVSDGTVSEDEAGSDEDEQQIQHLGSDLPDVPSAMDDLPTSDLPMERGQRSASRVMGAHQSHEARSEALRAAAAQLRGPTGVRISDGNLKRPSAARLPNPPYRNPTATKQRQLGGPRLARRDTYDLNDSPERPALRFKPRAANNLRPISPRKAKKPARKQVPEPAQSVAAQRSAKFQQQLDEQLLDSEAPEQAELLSSPRRSERQAHAKEQLHVRAGGEVTDNTQRTLYKDYFPDRLKTATAARQRLVEEEKEGALEDEEVHATLNDDITALEGQEEEVTPQKRGRGRPRKSGPSAPRKSAPPNGTPRVVVHIEEPAEEPADEAEEEPAEEPAPKQRRAKAPRNTSSPRKTSSPTKQRQVAASEAQRIADNERAEMEEAERHQAEEKQRKAEAAALARSTKQQRNSARAAASSAAAPRDTVRADEEYVPQQEDDDDEQENEEMEAEAVGGADDEEAQESSEGEVDDDLLEEPEAARRTAAGQKLDQARASEMFPGAIGELFPDSPEKQPEQPRREKKRGRSDEDDARTANMSRKRRHFLPAAEEAAQGEESEGEAEVEEDAGVNQQRLFCQYLPLRRIYRAIDDIGVQHIAGNPQPRAPIKLEDDDVKSILNACNEALVKVINGREAAADFSDIADQVDALYEATDEQEPNFKSAVKIKNIYFHLFPQLVRLVWHTVLCYETSDAGIEPGSPLTKGHLKHIKGLVKVIVDLGAGARKYDRPRSGLAIVQPVNNGIVAPLKNVYTALTKALVQLEQTECNRRQRQREAEQAARQTQREEREAQQEQELKRTRKKWQQLHFERLIAEGGIPGRDKRNHLRVLDPAPEYDENGAPFERIEVFHTRVGPSPAQVERANALVWDLTHLNALTEGLREYRGPNVYEKLFRRYCKRGGVLNKYNVTEIVTCAAGIKGWLEQQQGADGGLVDEWVRMIPVWTKGQPLGKENEADEDDEGHEVDE